MKMINWKAWGAAVLGSVMLVSCGTTAHIEKDENVNLNNYNSFAWLKEDEGKTEKLSELTETKIRAAVTQELQKNGWNEVKTKPDVVIDYDILVERTTRENRQPVYSQPYSRLIYNPYTRRYTRIHYPSQFLGYESYEQLIKEGTITITMIDTKTDKVIWQGWTTDQVNSNNLTSKEIQNAVKSIFKKFDVAKS